MTDAHTDILKRVIEIQHGGVAVYQRSVRVLGTVDRPDHWDGTVHVFTLNGHARARRAYAWSTQIQGSQKSRYFAVLHQGAVNTPLRAVRAAAAAIRQFG